MLVWIDLEMTGLDLAKDALIEIAVLVTDGDLNVQDDGLDLLIPPSAQAMDAMGDFVRKMHTDSGLLDELTRATLTMAQAEQQVLDYIKQYVPVPRKAPLAGNTIGTDRMFLAKYMPRIDRWLHYRNVDVSSVKELSRRWYPRAYFNAPAKDGGHRALADIRESIRELAYYRQAVFVPEPGPTSDEAREAAAAAVSSYASEV